MIDETLFDAEEKMEKALRLVQHATAIMAANEFQGDLVAAWELQARVLLQLHRPAEALALLHEAYQTTTKLGTLPVAWRILATKAQTLEMLGQLQAAEQEWQSAAAIIAKLATNIEDDNLRQQFLSDLRRASVLAHALSQHNA